MSSHSLLGSGQFIGDTGVSTGTLSYTNHAGAGLVLRKITVVVSWNDGATPRTVTALAYNGVGLTKVTGASSYVIGVNAGTGLETWYMDDAAMPAPGAHNLVVTLSGVTTRLRMDLLEYDYQAQGAMAAVNVATWSAVLGSAPYTRSLAVTSVRSNSLILSACAGNVNGSFTSVGTGQTKLLSHEAVSLCTAICSEPKVTAGSETSDYTFSGDPNRGVSMAVAISPPPATKLGIITPPSAAIVNDVVFPVQPVIGLLDAADQPVADAGVNVTAAILSGTGTLFTTLTVATDALGHAAFTDLKIFL